jgi:hypothetical protein
MEDYVNVIDSEIRVDNSNIRVDDGYKTLQHKKHAFLTAFAECGNISTASRLSGIARSNHYDWMQNDPDYPALFIEADKEAAEKLEQEARRRAVNGVSKPVFYKGEECGVVQEYSDTLLIFLLKGALPEKYKERYEGTLNGNIDVNVNITAEDRRSRIMELMSKSQIIEALPTTTYSVLHDSTTTKNNDESESP